jgi:hypothetical protein
MDKFNVIRINWLRDFLLDKRRARGVRVREVVDQGG